MPHSVRINSDNNRADNQPNNTDEKQLVCVCHVAPFQAILSLLGLVLHRCQTDLVDLDNETITIIGLVRRSFRPQ